MQEARETMALVNKRNILLEIILACKKKLMLVFTTVIKEASSPGRKDDKLIIW